MTEFIPRPGQDSALAYRSGYMGVSAVPGSGKTHTLSYLAANLIAHGSLEEDQEILVVTLVNAAVDNFRRRIDHFVESEFGLIKGLQYRIRTLHGLAHDLVRERPGLVGLADNFEIVDEREATILLNTVAQAWVQGHPDFLDAYLSDDIDAKRRDRIVRDDWPRLVITLATAFIKTAKDHQRSPEDLRRELDPLRDELPLAALGVDIYADYQRALAYRGAVDFDDLIRLAYHALQSDPGFLERQRYRWPYILEDEAQDSSKLQEDILRLIAGDGGNWVRVGDPNQAIYETFTTARPEYLLKFINQPDVHGVDLPVSGRSTPTIINLANELIRWTREQHPNPALRTALTEPYIKPIPPDFPQSNPPDQPDAVWLFDRDFAPQEEINVVVKSVEQWLKDNPRGTVAILTPRNLRGAAFTEALRLREIPYLEMLQSTIETRKTAGALANVLNYLADPKAPRLLVTLFKVWQRNAPDDDDDLTARLETALTLLRGCQHVETYLWPQPGRDWLTDQDLAGDDDLHTLLVRFREVVQRWQRAAILPIDQLILTLAQDLFHEPAELALTYKLAGVLKRAAATHPDWRLPELTEQLTEVAKNERRFIGFSDDDLGFDPDQHRGKAVVTTMHKAKGLEWDRVYLTSANTYSFPSALEGDQYISERWFIRDDLNLQAETLAQLDRLITTDREYFEGVATLRAREEYAAERLRLFYVGITRARRELVITWNTGRRGSEHPAVPFVALKSYRDTVRPPAPSDPR